MLNWAFNKVFVRENTTCVPKSEARRVRSKLETVHFTVGKLREKNKAVESGGSDGLRGNLDQDC
jgi:hypothetical protein